MLCQQAIHGVRMMSGTTREATVQRGGRRPASLVDSQLQHLESMVEYLARGGAAEGGHPLDHEYWEKRLRVLEETHELIASQRRRLSRLSDRLAGELRIGLKERDAA